MNKQIAQPSTYVHCNMFWVFIGIMESNGCGVLLVYERHICQDRDLHTKPRGFTQREHLLQMAQLKSSTGVSVSLRLSQVVQQKQHFLSTARIFLILKDFTAC